jgi:hypothetical protein
MGRVHSAGHVPTSYSQPHIEKQPTTLQNLTTWLGELQGDKASIGVECSCYHKQRGHGTPMCGGSSATKGEGEKNPWVVEKTNMG